MTRTASPHPDEHYPLRPGHSRAVIDAFRTPDGTVLRTRHWAAARPWARVLLVHGLSEHSGRYDHVGNWMAAAGIDARAYDHRGWGGSGGPRGHAERFSTYHDDLQAQVAALRAADPELPLVVYGHSLGGLIATGYLLDDRPRPDLLVVSGSGLLSNYPAWLVLAAKVLGRVVPTFHPPRPDNSPVLSRDPEVWAQFGSDPLHQAPSTGFGRLGLQEQGRVRAGLEALASAGRPFPVPALVLHGEDDRLVPPEVTNWYRPLAGVEVRTYPTLRHELHNEPEGEAVVADVIGWIREHVTGKEPAR